MIPFYINAKFLQDAQLAGVGRYGLEIATRLHKAFPQAPLLTPKNIPQKWLDLLPLEKIGRFQGAAWEQIDLPLYLRNQNVPLLNLANTSPLFYRNNALVIHDVLALTYPHWYSRKARFYFSLLLPRCARSSSCLISVSDYSRSEIARIFKISKDDIILAPCSTGDFWKPDLSTNTEGRYILGVSSIDPRKNFATLIRAFLLLDDPSLRLFIIGNQHKAFASSKLKIPKEAVKRVIFKGFLSDIDLRKLYTHAQAFLFPSLAEGFGIPPLEAMRCSCPVVVSDIPVFRENYQDAALYIDPLNDQEMANTISHLLNNFQMRENLIRKGLERSASFSWDESAKTILSALEKMAH